MADCELGCVHVVVTRPSRDLGEMRSCKPTVANITTVNGLTGMPNENDQEITGISCSVGGKGFMAEKAYAFQVNVPAASSAPRGSHRWEGRSSFDNSDWVVAARNRTVRAATTFRGK